jgi:Concanavalin A-like lectin/glucanases superfamily
MRIQSSFERLLRKSLARRSLNVIVAVAALAGDSGLSQIYEASVSVPYFFGIGPAGIADSETAGGAEAVGRVAAVAVDPASPSHWLIGPAQGGIWETRDAALTWQPRTDDQASLAMGAITFVPNSTVDGAGPVVFAGTGEPNFRGDDYSGAGLLLSTDGGTHWLVRNIQFAKTAFSAIRALAPSGPGGPILMSVATVRAGVGARDPALDTGVTPGAPTPGVFVSTDGGLSFLQVLDGEATDLIMDTSDFNRQYAALGEPYGALENGVYRTLDGWLHTEPERINGPWTSVTEPTQIGRIVLTVAPSDPNTVYVGVAGIRTGYTADLLGIWRTSNAWDTTPTWTQLPTPPILRDGVAFPRSWYYFALLADLYDPAVVYLCDYNVLRYSSSWTGAVAAHPDNHAMAWVPGPQNSERLLVGNDGGVWLGDAALTGWQDCNHGLAIGQPYKGAVDPSAASHLTLAGFQDNGSAAFLGNPAWKSQEGGDGGDCAISSSSPSTDWAVSAEGGAIYRSQDGGANWQLAANGLTDVLPDTIQFFVHFEKSPRNDDLFIAGTTRLYRCDDFFHSATPLWVPNSPPMVSGGKPDPISAMAFAPSDGLGQIYAFGTEGGQLRMTANGGASWNDLNSANNVPNSYISGLAFSPSDPNVLYVTLSGLSSPVHLYRTRNALAQIPSWAAVGPLLNLPHNCLAIDPNHAQRVYVGTDRGVWATSDDCNSWSELGPDRGLPNAAVFDLRIDAASRLTAFTHGRGVFYLGRTNLTEIMATPLLDCVRCPISPCTTCPPDYYFNPGDDFEFELPLRNILPINTVSLTATLLPSDYITPLSGPQSYGLVAGQGAAASRTFVFRATGTPNGLGLAKSLTGPLHLTFQLQDKSNSLGQVTVPFRLGTASYPLVQDFEQAQTPSLPAGWASTNFAPAHLWTITSNAPALTAGQGQVEEDFFDVTPPNTSIFVPAENAGQSLLTTPSFVVAGPQPQLYFLEAFRLSEPADGGILEISIGNEPFQDILAAGGSIIQNSYNVVLTNANPLGAAPAWSGDSGGWIPVYVNLPSTTTGQLVRLRWRLAISGGLTNGYWFLDNVVLSDPLFPNPPAAAPPTGPGCALSFNGINGVVQLGGSPLPPPWTAEFWVNRQPAFDDSAILLGDQATALKLEQFPSAGRAGFTRFGVADYSFNYTAPAGSWVHLAFVANPETTNTQLYVNGVLQDTYPATIPLGLGQLGGDVPNRYTNYMRGQLDEVRIWRVARDQAQLQALMNHPLLGTETGLVAYWRLDDCKGFIATEATGRFPQVATLSNGVDWVSSTVLFAPVAETLPASGITNGSATLNGMLNPNGVPAVCWFEWGGALGYTNSTPAIFLPAATTNMGVTARLAGLIPDAVYHFHLVASTIAGRTDGLDAQFIQPPAPLIRFSATASNVVLSWPAFYTGWLLQTTTNPATTGNWVDIPASGATNVISIVLDHQGRSAFYRLRSP